MNPNHSQRAHSKFSASGAERWVNCPGSVALSEGLPDKSSPWATEGTRAHEFLERFLLDAIRLEWRAVNTIVVQRTVAQTTVPREMIHYAQGAANFILNLHHKTPDSTLMVEDRVYLKFIHPEMFGTYDAAIVDTFGTLHVFDYKYGQGHAVSPGTPENPNLQMIFYGIGLAEQFHWNFKSVKLWIIQPRIKNFAGPLFVEMPTLKLNEYVDLFRDAVSRVERQPDVYIEGSWCHWCKAKSICPMKTAKTTARAQMIFPPLPDDVALPEDFY